MSSNDDDIVIVSHEPYMSEHICTKPDGTPVKDSLEAKSLNIRNMTYEEVKKYSFGKNKKNLFSPLELRCHLLRQFFSVHKERTATL